MLQEKTHKKDKEKTHKWDPNYECELIRTRVVKADFLKAVTEAVA